MNYLNNRFHSTTLLLLCEMEKFADVKDFGGKQINEFYFNYEKLKLHLNMFIDIVSRDASVQLNGLKDVIEFIVKINFAL